MSDEPTLTVEDGGLAAPKDEQAVKMEAFLQAVIRQTLTNSRLRIGWLMATAPQITDPIAGEIAKWLQGLCQDVEDLVGIACSAGAFPSDAGEDETKAAAYVACELTRIVAENQKRAREALVVPQAPALFLPPGVRKPD
jgi:hypothetical protein